jgi:hypothetical protein
MGIKKFHGCVVDESRMNAFHTMLLASMMTATAIIDIHSSSRFDHAHCTVEQLARAHRRNVKGYTFDDGFTIDILFCI